MSVLQSTVYQQTEFKAPSTKLRLELQTCLINSSSRFHFDPYQGNNSTTNNVT